jgi:putative FmdB family regulatory protein
MPAYDLQCTVCEHEFEVMHAMSEPHPDCPKCQGKVVQLYKSVPLFPDTYSPMAPRRGRGRGIGHKRKEK